jgi:hypothetical protein
MKPDPDAAFNELLELLKEMKSKQTGVEHRGTVIPVGTVVVEHNRFFAHASKAVRRHKVHCVKITSRFRATKKYV